MTMTICYFAVMAIMDATGRKGDFSFEEVCEIVAPIAAKYGILRVYLFGSRARGDCKEDSDYDFCIASPEGCGAMHLGAFLYEIKEALDAEVDVICENGIKKQSLIEEILKDRRLIYESGYGMS